jgi:hypothetical protein
MLIREKNAIAHFCEFKREKENEAVQYFPCRDIVGIVRCLLAVGLFVSDD